jgi:hypothetical protein
LYKLYKSRSSSGAGLAAWMKGTAHTEYGGNSFIIKNDYVEDTAVNTILK